MGALLICVACNVGIFLAFRGFQHLRINTFQAITFNYCTCVVIGVFFVGWPAFRTSITPENPWLLPAVILGFIFIGTFYIMARTTQLYSMTVASIASKMSLIIPVLVSLFILGVRAKEYTALNYLGMGAALAAITFSSMKSGGLTQPSPVGKWYLPVLVFVLGGVIDTSLNYLNLTYVTENQEGVFPIVIFLVAALVGVVTLLITRSAVSTRALVGGMLLGSVNYFSMFFLLRGLSSFQNDGALFFPLLNVGIILATAIVSAAVFKEQFTRTNIVGLLLAVAAIFLLSYQELLGR